MKKILITGGNGLLGTYLQKVKGDYEFYPTHYNGLHQWRQLDITDKVSIYRLFSDFKFDVIIHTAGLGNVDFCERVPHISDLVNYEGTKNLIDILNELKHKPLFVHISTNAVYDGDDPSYDESSSRQPINKYGFSKKLAEEYVMSRYENWLIVRPFMLFGNKSLTGRSNWFEIVLAMVKSNECIELIDDIIWQPTSADFAAKAILTLIDKELSKECFNLSQGESISLYDFSMKMVKASKPLESDSEIICHSLISPISHKEFKTVAKRPIDTSYNISKLKRYVEIPTIEEELRKLYK